jgi:hypothetical protein
VETTKRRVVHASNVPRQVTGQESAPIRVKTKELNEVAEEAAESVANKTKKVNVEAEVREVKAKEVAVTDKVVEEVKKRNR